MTAVTIFPSGFQSSIHPQYLIAVLGDLSSSLNIRFLALHLVPPRDIQSNENDTILPTAAIIDPFPLTIFSSSSSKVILQSPLIKSNDQFHYFWWANDHNFYWKCHQHYTSYRIGIKTIFSIFSNPECGWNLGSWLSLPAGNQWCSCSGSPQGRWKGRESLGFSPATCGGCSGKQYFAWTWKGPWLSGVCSRACLWWKRLFCSNHPAIPIYTLVPRYYWLSYDISWSRAGTLYLQLNSLGKGVNKTFWCLVSYIWNPPSIMVTNPTPIPLVKSPGIHQNQAPPSDPCCRQPEHVQTGGLGGEIHWCFVIKLIKTLRQNLVDSGDDAR